MNSLSSYQQNDTFEELGLLKPFLAQNARAIATLWKPRVIFILSFSHHHLTPGLNPVSQECFLYQLQILSPKVYSIPAGMSRQADHSKLITHELGHAVLPAELLDFKLRIMKSKGYRIEAPYIARSDFLKEDIPGCFGQSR